MVPLDTLEFEEEVNDVDWVNEIYEGVSNIALSLNYEPF